MTTLGTLAFSVPRTLVIRAPRPLVFRFFTDTARWARWWGEGSSIQGRVGGAVRIVYPGGTVASGQVLELVPDERVVFTYGYEGEAKPIAPGASRVTIRLEDDPGGTRLDFLHEVADAAARDLHVQGWRYQLAVFAGVVTAEAHAGAEDLAERWIGAWNEADQARRDSALAALVTPTVVFQDAYSCTAGLEDLQAHVSAAKVHMAGVRLARTGPVRQCQGTALFPWRADKPDGTPLSAGTTVLELSTDGRIARAVGFWG